MRTITATEVVLDGLSFGEGPRWRDGELYFSDMHNGVVIAMRPDGSRRDICSVAAHPSGLGWLPDGRLLIVSMHDRKLLSLESDDSLAEYADLSSLAGFHCNDMVVGPDGTAWVGNFGFDLHAGAKPCSANLIRVAPDGAVSLAAPDLMFPNGTVITPDEKTLIVGESFGSRLTAFDIADGGQLVNRREWAALPDGHVPDGICLDAEGAIWSSSPTGNATLRIREGGEVTDIIEHEVGSFACMLGDEDRCTLYICTAAHAEPEKAHLASARIERVRVQVPGVGWP